MAEYEIKSHNSPVWYKGYIDDYDENKNQFLVIFDGNWKNPQYVEPQNIRPRPAITSPNWVPEIGDKCECKFQAANNEPFGWRSCKIKAKKNNNITISYLDFDSDTNTISKHFLRPTNDKKLLPRNLKKEKIDIPADLMLWMQSNPKEIDDLRSKLIHLKIDEKNSQLTLIGSQKPLTLVKGIIDLHFQKQKDLNNLASKAQLDEAKLEEQKQKEGNAIKRSFRIHPLLTGILLGPKRKNTQQIKQEFPDIVYIKPKNGMCEIAATNPQTLEEACGRLEVVARKIAIPKKEMGSIIGSNGSIINKIKERAGNDDVRIISMGRFPIEFERLKERYEGRLNNRKKQENQHNKNKQQQVSGDVDEFIDEYYVDNINNMQIDDIFSPSDNVDLTNGDTKDVDYLIVIGRRSRVELCITMIEITLDRARKFQEHKDKIKDLKKLIRDLKGYDYYENEPEQENTYDENYTNGKTNTNAKTSNQAQQKSQNQQKKRKNKKEKTEEEQPEQPEQEVEDDNNNNQNAKKDKNKNKNKNKKNDAKSKQKNEKKTNENNNDDEDVVEKTYKEKNTKNSQDNDHENNDNNENNANNENENENNENQKNLKKNKKRKRKTTKKSNENGDTNDNDNENNEEGN